MDYLMTLILPSLYPRLYSWSTLKASIRYFHLRDEHVWSSNTDKLLYFVTLIWLWQLEMH